MLTFFSTVCLPAILLATQFACLFVCLSVCLAIYARLNKIFSEIIYHQIDTICMLVTVHVKATLQRTSL